VVARANSLRQPPKPPPSSTPTVELAAIRTRLIRRDIYRVAYRVADGKPRTLSLRSPAAWRRRPTKMRHRVGLAIFDAATAYMHCLANN
jgi:hypothetical protein